ncbi:unnamed protein product [Amoebophrya sp. A120]|nr:unnamed protein product [Amoebophrya sp. A120]|eukprot:GSA120T00004052001.1
MFVPKSLRLLVVWKLSSAFVLHQCTQSNALLASATKLSISTTAGRSTSGRKNDSPPYFAATALERGGPPFVNDLPPQLHQDATLQGLIAPATDSWNVTNETSAVHNAAATLRLSQKRKKLALRSLGVLGAATVLGGFVVTPLTLQNNRHIKSSETQVVADGTSNEQGPLDARAVYIREELATGELDIDYVDRNYIPIPAWAKYLPNAPELFPHGYDHSTSANDIRPLPPAESDNGPVEAGVGVFIGDEDDSVSTIDEDGPEDVDMGIVADESSQELDTDSSSDVPEIPPFFYESTTGPAAFGDETLDIRPLSATDVVPRPGVVDVPSSGSAGSSSSSSSSSTILGKDSDPAITHIDGDGTPAGAPIAPSVGPPQKANHKNHHHSGNRNTDHSHYSKPVAGPLPHYCRPQKMANIRNLHKDFTAFTNLPHLPDFVNGDDFTLQRTAPRPVVIVISEYWHASTWHPTLGGYVHDTCNGWAGFLHKDRQLHDVAVVVPFFRNLVSKTHLYWKADTTYLSQRGYESTNQDLQDSNENLSSFRVLDEIVNTLRKTNLASEIFVAGHSGGCQFVQRWSLYSQYVLKSDDEDSSGSKHGQEAATDGTKPVHVHMSSCGSYGFLDHLRPSVQWKNHHCLPGSSENEDCTSPSTLRDGWVDIGLGNSMTSGELREEDYQKKVETAIPHVFHREDYPSGHDFDYVRGDLVPKEFHVNEESSSSSGIDVAHYLPCHVFKRFQFHLVINEFDRCTDLQNRSGHVGTKISAVANWNWPMREFQNKYLYPDHGCKSFLGQNKRKLDQENLPRLTAATKMGLAQGYTRYQRQMVFYFWLKKHMDAAVANGGALVHHELHKEHHSAWPLMQNVKQVLLNTKHHPDWYGVPKVILNKCANKNAKGGTKTASEIITLDGRGRAGAAAQSSDNLMDSLISSTQAELRKDASQLIHMGM